MKSIENRNFYDFYRPEEYLFSEKNIGYYKKKLVIAVLREL